MRSLNPRPTLFTAIVGLLLIAAISLFVLRPRYSIASDNLLSPAMTPNQISEEGILAMMDTAHQRYRNLHVHAIEAEGPATATIELWISQASGQYRLELNIQSPVPERSGQVIRISDGERLYTTERIPSDISVNPQVLRPEHIVPRPAAPEPDTIYPSWINLAIGGRISSLMSPTILTQGLLDDTAVQLVGPDEIIGRDTYHISVQLSDGSTDHFWVDLQKGVVLHEEVYMGDQLIYSFSVDLIEFDPLFSNPDQLFSNPTQ